MGDWASSLLEWRKIGLSLAGVVCVFSGFLLFLPNGVLQTAGLIDLRNENLLWIGLVFFVAASIFAAQLLESAFKLAKSYLDEFRIKKNRRVIIRSLTLEEKAFLREFVDSGQASVAVSLSHPVISALNSRQIMFRASNLSDHFGNFPFSLQPWARLLVEAEPDLLL